MKLLLERVDIKEQITTILMIFLGNLILAFGIVTFVVPSNFITGGATGLALMLTHISPLHLETGVTIINIVMFILGFLVLGKKFAATTLISTFLYPTSLALFQRIPVLATLNQDPVLAAVFGGSLIGLGVGLVIRVGASTGGMDIPPIIISRYTGIPIPYILNLLDILILTTQLPYSNPQSVLYSILVVVCTTLVMDKVLLLGSSQTQVMIISAHYKEINAMIQEKICRGTTFLDAVSGRLKNRQKVILSVISNRQLKDLTRLVNKIDPNAFIIINRVNEVRGGGFTLKREECPMVEYQEE